MRFALSLLLIIVAVFLFEWRSPPSPQERLQAKRRLETPGPFPSDWFLQQRIWPDGELDFAALSQARAEAERRRHSALDEQPHWIPAGPDNIGGRITDLVADPLDEDILYVAAASGGVFKTTDGGDNWTPILDSAPGMSMGAIAMVPTNPQTLYVGTGEANSAGYSYPGSGVYKSVDGGLNWNFSGLENSRYINRIVVDPEDNQRVWAAVMGELYTPSSERGLYRSTDGGVNWTRSLFVNDTTGCNDVVINPDNPLIVYAAMWHRVRGPEYRQAGGRGSGIHKSIDGGETWTRLSDGLPPIGNDVGRIGLAISASNPQVLYAIYADHPGYFAGVYRSGDGGESWNRTNDGNLEDIYSSFGWYFGNIRVRPDDEDVVFVLGVELWRTTNGGSSWVNLDDFDFHVDHHAMWFNPATPFRSYIGNDGGLYRSINNGNDWTFISGLPINQFYAATVDFQHPERRYGGTQDNGTLRTLTGDVDDWERIFGGDGFYCSVDPVESDVIYAEYQYGMLVRSTDGGFDWEFILDGIDEDERTNWSTPVVMDPANRFTLYYGAERLYKSTNRGTFWNAVSPDLTDGGGSGNLGFGTISTIGVSVLDSDVIYVGTDDANVWSTSDGGASWQNRSAGLPNRWITRVVPSPHAVNEVYVTVSGFRNAEADAHLFFSDNYGESWQNISGDLPAEPLNDVVPDPDYPGRLYVASDFGAFVTTNHGDSWEPLGQNLPTVPVLQFVLHNPTRQLVAATHGRSMLTLALDSLELNRPPVIAEALPAAFDTLFIPQEVEFSVSASDPDEDELTYEWTRNGESAGQGDAVTLNFELVQPETVRVVVSDGELAASHQWAFAAVLPDAAGNNPAQPAGYTLLNVYPNPFNIETTIHYTLASPGPVHIDVFDIQGRKVQAFASEFSPAGSSRITWRARELASGTYFVTLNHHGSAQSRKVLLLK